MFQKSKIQGIYKPDSKLTFVIYTIFTILIIFVWTHWFAPELKKLPDNFSYTANILSLDNFYDEAVQQFEGQHISKTTFSFEVIAKNPAYLTIQNSFTVSKLSGKPIFAVSRLYFIDPRQASHVAVRHEEERSGYLFAPHYVEKQPFTYWHINYDAPAQMQYVNEDKINGLTVYHYIAHYTADQTANLTYLPGVPKVRGIKTDVALQLWVEPVTGWLVKYQDNTLAYYYDIKTGKLLNPWNRFSNRYTQNTINEKVDEATWLKWKFLFIDFGMPFFIVFLMIFLFYRAQIKKYVTLHVRAFVQAYMQNRESINLGVSWMLLIVALISSIDYVFQFQKQPSVYKIGISQWDENAGFLSAIQGFKDGLAEYGFVENKNIQFIIKNPNSRIEDQINIIQSFVLDNVDIIFALTTPGTLAAKSVTNKIPIVFTDVSYPVESEIISADSAIESNLVGTLNYISPAEEFFRFDVSFPYTKVLGFVHHKGDSDSEIQYQEYKRMLARRNITVIDIPAIDFNDIQNQLQTTLKQQHYNSLFVACDTLMRDGGSRIAAEFSRAQRIPSFTCDQDGVTHGVMLGYFADLYSIGKRAGIKAALILRGAKPNWLHTEAPDHGVLMTNPATAKLLGITLPLNALEQTP